MAKRTEVKPELIAFSQYKLGGVQSFYHNLLENDPYNFFDKKWILTRSIDDKDALPPAPFNCCNELIINYNLSIGAWRVAYQIQKYISNREGIVLVNHPIELLVLHYYFRSKKLVIFICHDTVYLNWAQEYAFLIGAFIVHNVYFFEELKKMFPERQNDIYFLPFGIPLSHVKRKVNFFKKLNIAFVARMHQSKGIYDLPKIDDLLKKKGIEVCWTIVGDGPEKLTFSSLVTERKNFSLYTPPDTKTLFELIQHSDIFLLPSSLDGTPVALLEAMSVGLVPIIYEFNPGIKNIVTENIGYITEVGDIETVAKIIESLNFDRRHLEQLSESCLKKANKDYNVKDRVKDYYDLFLKYDELKKNVSVTRPTVNRLDHPFIPLRLANYLRAIKNRIFR